MKLDAVTMAQQQAAAAQERQKRGAFVADRTTALLAELDIGPKLAHYLACREWESGQAGRRLFEMEQTNARY